MTREEIMERKNKLGITFEQLAERSGVPLGTLQKFLYGYTAHTRYDTVMAINRALDSFDPEFNVHEALPAVRYNYKKQGQYTLDDYYELPDEARCEIIDGVIYDMGAPTPLHQELVFEIAMQLRNHIKRNNGRCKMFISPIDVILGNDSRTVVQPDVIVVCRPEIISEKRIEDAPDLAVEVLSPSTAAKDRKTKVFKYGQTGVRECWLVDPEKKTVLVYFFDDPDLIPKIYSFGDEIPVSIWNGECKVDLKEFK
jgi:Uma2 family endonuclease